MNVATHVNDRTSTRDYLAGEMYRKFLASANLLPPTEGTPRPWTHKPSAEQQAETLIRTAYTFSPIDDHHGVMTPFFHLAPHLIIRHAIHANSVSVQVTGYGLTASQVVRLIGLLLVLASQKILFWTSSP